MRTCVFWHRFRKTCFRGSSYNFIAPFSILPTRLFLQNTDNSFLTHSYLTDVITVRPRPRSSYLNTNLIWQEITLKNCQRELMTWRRHQMGIFSALLAICAGNWPVTGEFPAQRPVRRSFDVFFDERLSKQSRGWCSKHHCAHYDVIVMGPVRNEPLLIHCQIYPWE